MNLPEPIPAYFAAANAFQAEAAAAHFTPDAHVHDENHDHVGREAVRAWIEDASHKYRPQIEVLSADTRGDEVMVTNRICGDFPGSPIEPRFTFAVSGDRIGSLEVAP